VCVSVCMYVRTHMCMCVCVCNGVYNAFDVKQTSVALWLYYLDVFETVENKDEVCMCVCVHCSPIHTCTHIQINTYVHT
jgi:hypothetical protein